MLESPNLNEAVVCCGTHVLGEIRKARSHNYKTHGWPCHLSFLYFLSHHISCLQQLSLLVLKGILSRWVLVCHSELTLWTHFLTLTKEPAPAQEMYAVVIVAELHLVSPQHPYFKPNSWNLVMQQTCHFPGPTSVALTYLAVWSD